MIGYRRMRIVFPACAVIVLAGCAGSLDRMHTETLLPEIDVVQVKESSDEALRIAQELRLEMDVLNTKVMEIDNKLILLSEEISGVSIAKIEEMENRLSLLIEAYKELHARMDALQAAPRARASGPAATFSPAASSPLLKTSSEYESYHAALRAFNGRNYEQAITQFKNILEKYPQGTYADNCEYWIGESYYALGDYASAIAAFKRVFNYSASSKADDSQLKLGLSYLKMGQYGAAKAELKTLIDRYPASEYVPRAKKYLADMK